MRSLSIVLFVFIMFAANALGAGQQNKAHWHGSMWNLAQSLTQAMPLLTTPHYKPTPHEKAVLKKTIGDLTQYSQSLTGKDMIVPSQDPSLRYVAQAFASDMQNINKNQNRWSFQQKQEALAKVSRYCVACHIRARSASAPFPIVGEKSLSSMGAYAKGNYYLAIRQFGLAIVEFEKVLKNKSFASKSPKLWNEAVLKMLATSVRVHNNPNLTLELISSLFDNQSYPQDLRKAAKVWRADAKTWEKEKQSKASIKQVNQLIQEGLRRENTLKNSGLIVYLRAMSALNDYLKKGGMKARSEQTVLYHSGRVSQYLGNIGILDYPQSYFQACAAIHSKSRTGRLCKAKL